MSKEPKALIQKLAIVGMIVSGVGLAYALVNLIWIIYQQLMVMK